MSNHINPESDLYAAHFLHEEIQGNVNEQLAEKAREADIDPWYHDADAADDSWYEDNPPIYQIYAVLLYARKPHEAYIKALRYIDERSDEEGDWYYFGDGGRRWSRFIGLLDLDIVSTCSTELPKRVRKEGVDPLILDWTAMCDSNGQPKVPPKEELTVFKQLTIVR